MSDRLRVAILVTFTVLLDASSSPAAQQPSPSKGAPVAAAGTIGLADALNEFQRQLDNYVKLRQDLARKLQLPPLATAPGAAELSKRQEALAKAIQTARPGAKPGNLVNPVVAAHITRLVTADAKRRKPAAESAVLTEVPRGQRPLVNKIYPADAALPTVPPLLLSELPRLPDNLQYRFFGRHVAILDADVQIIIDYVADALPPH